MKNSHQHQAECNSVSHGRSHLTLYSGTSSSSANLNKSALSIDSGSRSQAHLEENLSFVKKTDEEQEQRLRESRYSTRRELNYIHGLFERKQFYTEKENQDYSWKNKSYFIWNHRTGYCHRRQFDSSQNTALYSNGKIENLFKCGTAQCVSCSKNYYCEKHQEIQRVLNHYANKGLSFYLVTLTVSHNDNDSLADLNKLASACKTKLMKHKCIKDLNSIAYVVRKEETIGRNGWHVHYHIIFVFDAELLDFMIDDMKKQWVKICKSMGNNVTYENGLDVKHLSNGAEGAVDYVCKTEHSAMKKAALEIASVNTKSGRNESYTVHELIGLAAAGKWNDIHFGIDKTEHLILEYYSVKNRKTFQFSKSYYNCLENLGEEDCDNSGEAKLEQSGKRIEIQSKVVYQLLESKLWNKILMVNVKHNNVHDMLGEIWEVIEKSDFESRYGYDKDNTQSLRKLITIESSDNSSVLSFRRTIHFRKEEQLRVA